MKECGESLADMQGLVWGQAETWRTAPPPMSNTQEEFLDREFYDGYGSSRGEPSTLWTQDWVYFPVVHDGMEWVASVPRNPCKEVTAHVGGQ